MAKEVKIPQISEGVESANVSEVLVKEGDSIEKEQALIVLETDKASVEVPSSDTGKVQEIKVQEGDEVNVGDVILILEGDGEEEESDEKEKAKEEKDQETEKTEQEDEQKSTKEEKDKEDDDEDGKKEDKKAKEKPEEEEAEEEKGKTEEKEEKKEEKEVKEDKEEDTEKKEKPEKKKEKPDDDGEPEEQEVPASPAVRRLARELGVDISSVEGNGPGGRITEEDVKSHSKKQDKGKTAEPERLSLPDFSKWGATEAKPLSSIRVATGKSTTSSWQNIPHVFQFDEADISGIEKYMEKNQQKAEKKGGKLTITAILVKIAANALQQFPKFNASIDVENEEMVLKKYINISMAVDTDKGLLMPVIKDVDKKSIFQLAAEISEIAEKARSGELSPEEMKGGNFAISNLGGIGGTNFTPIIYHPQVAILGVSKAKIQPRYIEDNFEPRDILPLSLSYDHRLIDGAEGAKFLNWIAQALEDPYKGLLGA